MFGERRLKARVDRFDRAMRTRVIELPAAARTVRSDAAASSAAATKASAVHVALTPNPSPGGRGVGGEGLSPLEWNRKFLPQYFTHEPADFHLWLDRILQDLHRRRGARLTLIAPREAAKSTWITLAYVLRCIVERWESYVLILSDTGEQANKLLRDLRAELESSALLAECYPAAAGWIPHERTGREPGLPLHNEWRDGALRVGNGVLIESLGRGSGCAAGAIAPTDRRSSWWMIARGTGTSSRRRIGDEPGTGSPAKCCRWGPRRPTS